MDLSTCIFILVVIFVVVAMAVAITIMMMSSWRSSVMGAAEKTRGESPPTIYTIGHSTRPIKDFISVLKKYHIDTLVDVRSLPGSTTNPQYNREDLEKMLSRCSIDYVWMESLGGRRRPDKNSDVNQGWHHSSFRGYADYMQTEAFASALSALMALAKRKTVAIMCAEVLPWRCHRSLIADALMVRKWRVVEIYNETKAVDHVLTSFASVDGTRVTYPGSGPLTLESKK
jgi:uncharacterized protein (DUF488 family)